MKISVIVAVYNAEKYIRLCLDSVKAQTYRNWECICVDDGSTDSSGRILDEYAASDHRFVVVHKSNGGVGAARNAALKVVTGDFITFLDNDDLLNENWLAEAAHAIAQDNPDLLRMDYLNALTLPSGFLTRPNEDRGRMLEGQDAFKYAWDTFTYRGFVWVCFIRSSIACQLTLDEKINGKEDGIYLLMLTPWLKKVFINNFKGYFYRATPGSLLKKKRSAIQCISYINAYRDLWRRQREMSIKYECEDTVVKNIVACVRNDIIEWASRPRDYRHEDSLTIRKAYLTLLKEIGRDVPWGNKNRYIIGFHIWRRTGCPFLITVTTKLFLFIRQCIDALKFSRASAK